MNEVELFGWVMAIASVTCVAIWLAAAAMVLRGAWELCGDIWRKVFRK